MGDYYAHSTMPRAALVTTTKKRVLASQALFDMLEVKTGVRTQLGRDSKKMPPRRIPARHKVDTLHPNQTIDPFREMNTYLNYEELMEEEEDDYALEDAAQEMDVVKAASQHCGLAQSPKGESSRSVALLDWTDGEAELRQSMSMHKKAGKTFGAEFFLTSLTTLRLYKAGIVELDKAFMKLENVTEVTLSGNSIEVLQNLPPKTQVVQAQCNLINRIGDLGPCSQVIAHLGLSFNKMEELSSLQQDLPEMRSIDLGCNAICERDKALDVLVRFPRLKNLVLTGNPCTMTPFYRADVVARFMGEQGGGLRWLDDVTVSSQDRASAEVERIEEQRLAPVIMLVHCETAEALDRLNDELPEEEMIDGPWKQEGEGAPPPPALSYEYVIEVECLGVTLQSDPVKTDAAESIVKLTIPPLPLEECAAPEGEEQPPQEDAEPPQPRPMQLEISPWMPSAEARDTLRGKGIEVHILRRARFSHQENEAFYSALLVPEDVTDEEEIAALRQIPPDVVQDTLLRVAQGEMMGLVEGIVDLQVDAKMYKGKVVEKARQDNWAIMLENAARLNTEALEAAPQAVKIRVEVKHDWIDPTEPEEEPEEEPEPDPKAKKK